MQTHLSLPDAGHMSSSQNLPIDPMEPPKFRHKKVPRSGGSPPVPVMHSPPRPVTVKDQQVPRCCPSVSTGFVGRGQGGLGVGARSA